MQSLSTIEEGCSALTRFMAVMNVSILNVIMVIGSSVIKDYFIVSRSINDRHLFHINFHSHYHAMNDILQKGALSNYSMDLNSKNFFTQNSGSKVRFNDGLMCYIV